MTRVKNNDPLSGKKLIYVGLELMRHGRQLGNVMTTGVDG